MSVRVGSIEFHTGPDTIGAPDSLIDPLTALIDGARDSLDVAVQELESEPIARALIAARRRGVVVRLVLEHDYLTVNRTPVDPWVPGGVNQANRNIYEALLRSKVDVRSDLNPNIFHQKFIVRDAKSRSRAAVLTGSTNFTPTGVGTNLNHVVIIHGKRVARQFDAEFKEIWNGTFGTVRVRHEAAPRVYRVSKVRVKAIFAPDHAPEMELMKQMLKAKNRIDFAVFTFAKSSGIDDAMIAISQSGVRVRGILDGKQGNQVWAATHDLADNGVQVFLARHGGGLKKLHHKLAVIDDEVVIAGSFNYTGPATDLNDENVLVIGDMDDTSQTARQRQRQIGLYARLEIDRIIAAHGIPV